MEQSVSGILRKHYSRIGLACFLLLAASFLSQFVLLFLAELLIPAVVQKTWFLTALSFVSLYGVGFPFFLLLLPKAPEQLPEKQKLGGMGEFFACLIMCMGILYPLNLLGTGLTGLLGRVLGTGGGNPLDTYLGSIDLWTVTVFAVILAPIMEELCFRKLLLDRMRTIDRPGAILFSALAFGLTHGNLSQFFYAFGVGLLFGCIYTRTGRIRYTILLHILVNAMGSLVPMILTRDLGDVDLAELASLWPIPENLPALLALGAFELVVLCCTVAGVILLIRRFPRLLQRTPEDRLGGPLLAFRTQFLTGGFLAFLLASAAQMAVSILIT